MPRLYVTLTDQELQTLAVKAEKLGFSCSQYAKYLLSADLQLPQKMIPPLLDLQKQMESYIQTCPVGKTFIVSSPFPDWWSFDTGTKRALAWHLKHLKEAGLCEKTEEHMPNGTAIYKRV